MVVAAVVPTRPSVLAIASLRNGLNAFYAETHRDLTTWGIASICSSVLLLLAYYCVPRVRRTPGWQFLYSSVCEIYVAGGFVALSLVGTDSAGTNAFNVEHLLCNEYSSLMLSVLGFDMAANSWRLFMYVDLIVVYHNPFWSNAGKRVYHLIVFLIAAAWVLTIRSTDVLCSGEEDGDVNVLNLTWGLVYGPFLLFVLLGGSLYVAVKALLSREESNNRISRLARQRVCEARRLGRLALRQRSVRALRRVHVWRRARGKWSHTRREGAC